MRYQKWACASERSGRWMTSSVCSSSVTMDGHSSNVWSAALVNQWVTRSSMRLDRWYPGQERCACYERQDVSTLSTTKRDKCGVWRPFPILTEQRIWADFADIFSCAV